mgnify:CR=1 FL=1
MVLPLAVVAVAAGGAGGGAGGAAGGLLGGALASLGFALTEDGQNILKTIVKSLIKVKAHQLVYNSFKNNESSDSESRIIALEIANELSNTIGEALF